jgi:hypothetical protein
VILARMKLRRPDDLPDPAEIEERVRDLERELDACFLDEIAPALERARRSREDAA